MTSHIISREAGLPHTDFFSSGRSRKSVFFSKISVLGFTQMWWSGRAGTAEQHYWEVMISCTYVSLANMFVCVSWYAALLLAVSRVLV